MAEEVVAPGEAATPLATPLVSGPLGRISPLRMNKTMIQQTAAGITIPPQVARPHGAVSAPDLGARGGGKICPRPPPVVGERCLWLEGQRGHLT